MFKIIRDSNGSKESLMDSNTQNEKTFDDFESADDFVQQLNQNIIPSKQWKVSAKSELRKTK